MKLEVIYVVNCKKYVSIKKFIELLNEESEYYRWEFTSSKFAVNEITVSLSKWQRTRRLVIVRKAIELKIKD